VIISIKEKEKLGCIESLWRNKRAAMRGLRWWSHRRGVSLSFRWWLVARPQVAVLNENSSIGMKT